MRLIQAVSVSLTDYMCHTCIHAGSSTLCGALFTRPYDYLTLVPTDRYDRFTSSRVKDMTGNCPRSGCYALISGHSESTIAVCFNFLFVVDVRVPGNRVLPLLFAHVWQLDEHSRFDGVTAGEAPWRPIKKYHFPPTKDMIIALTDNIEIEQLALGNAIDGNCNIVDDVVAAMPSISVEYPKRCTKAAVQRDIQQQQRLLPSKEVAVREGILNLPASKKRKRAARRDEGRRDLRRSQT